MTRYGGYGFLCVVELVLLFIEGVHVLEPALLPAFVIVIAHFLPSCPLLLPLPLGGAGERPERASRVCGECVGNVPLDLGHVLLLYGVRPFVVELQALFGGEPAAASGNLAPAMNEEVIHRVDEHHTRSSEVACKTHPNGLRPECVSMWILRLDLFLKVRPHFSQATLATEASLVWHPPLLLPTLVSDETSAEEWTSR